MRPHTQLLWRGFSAVEQKRFFRHLGSYWGSHRHRIAPQVAHAVEEQRQLGRLQHVAGNVKDVTDYGDDFMVSLRPRYEFDGHLQTLVVSYIINCTGPNDDYQMLDCSLFNSLFANCDAEPHALGMQLAVDDLGAIVNAKGQASTSIFALGPLCRGQSYEITAVPDIRKQSFLLSAHLLS